MDGLNVEQQQTHEAIAPKTVNALRVIQQHAVSKNADWKSVF